MLEKLFGFKKTEHSIRTEIVAGITIFLTMSYILAVNPAIFSAIEDMSSGAVFTATALASIVGTLIMAILAKMPFGLAPGMGLNAFFVYTICLGMGYSWQFAFTAVFIEGLLFIILTITNLREMIINAIPPSLRHATGAGIGLFIALIGLQNMGVIVKDDSTMVALGDVMSKGSLLGFFGLFITGTLVVKKVRGALLIGLIITSLLGIPMGLANFNGLVSMPHSVKDIFLQFEWDNIFTIDMLIVVLTMLFIDIFDTMGTLVGVCNKVNMISEDGSIPKIKQAFMADAIATTFGACIGTNTTTTYVESAAGVAQGGRTGLTAFVVACCFAIALFFSPLFLAMPSAATSPILIIVGLFMLDPIKRIPFDDYAESIPAFICMIMMPLAYSISAGMLLGMISYVAINILCKNFSRLTPAMYILAAIFVFRYIFL